MRGQHLVWDPWGLTLARLGWGFHVGGRLGNTSLHREDGAPALATVQGAILLLVTPFSGGKVGKADHEEGKLFSNSALPVPTKELRPSAIKSSQAPLAFNNSLHIAPHNLDPSSSAMLSECNPYKGHLESLRNPLQNLVQLRPECKARSNAEHLLLAGQHQRLPNPGVITY